MDTAKRSFHRGLIKHLIGMNLPLPTFYRLQEQEKLELIGLNMLVSRLV